MPFALAILVFALQDDAFAHPQSGTLRGAADPGGITPGQRIEANIEGGRLRVDYYAEVATMRIYQEAREENAGPTWALGRVEEMRGGVRAKWDGVALPLIPLAIDKPVTTGKEADFVEFHLAGEAMLPSPAGELRLEMGNFPDEPCYSAVSIDVSGDLVVTQSTLVNVKSGTLRDNVHGAWRRVDAARVATLSLRPARIWERGAAGPLPSRMAGMIPWPLPVKVGAWSSLGIFALFALIPLARRWATRKRFANR